MGVAEQVCHLSLNMEYGKMDILFLRILLTCVPVFFICLSSANHCSTIEAQERWELLAGITIITGVISFIGLIWTMEVTL